MPTATTILTLLCVVLTAASGRAQTPADVDAQSLIQETQKMKQTSESLKLVWWIPTEFWQVSFANEAGMTEQQKQDFYKTVEPYIVFCVVDAKLSNFGSVTPLSREAMATNISLSVEGGATLKPLADAELSAEAVNLFALMKPVLGNMLGQIGRGMEFVCFTGVDDAGARLLDPASPARFSVRLREDSFAWRLPLGSLLPPRFDPDTRERFPGNYLYSPFTGKELSAEKPQD